MSDNRFIRITTPLGDELKLLSFSGREELSRLFQFEVELESTNYNIEYDRIVGQAVTLELDTSRSGTRYFHGYVSRFVQMAPQRRKARYQATVVPWLWLLTRNSDCRIFQDMTVPEIVEDVFQRHHFSDFEWRLSNRSQYTAWEYCVQYRETDFNFISRMLEQEGIYYYFRHDDATHTLVLCDGPSSHEAFSGYEDIIYRPSAEGASDAGYISDWRISREVQPSAYEHTDFDFLEPRKDLLASSQAQNPSPHEPSAIFDYPGEYEQPDEASAWARVRLQELQVRVQVADGAADARGLAAGSTFQLKEHFRNDQCRKHLVLSVHHMAHGGSYDADSAASGNELPPTYHCTFRAIDAEVNYRAPRMTPKPLIQGVQTAVVVGPAGDEIHTDDHARIKVQFHWDRYGERNEKSSCWIRVSQSNAGTGWGSMITPRIGQEVIVEFLEGDPDRPIITGRVYNGDNAPPYAGGQGVVSGLKSQTHKGSGSNEMSMDDTAKSEKITIHAQHDMSTTVENDQSITVKSGNRTLGVNSGSNSETIKGNSSLTVQAGSRTVDVTGGDYSATSNDAAVKLHGVGAGVQITGDSTGVEIIGNGGTGVKTTGNPNFEAYGTSKAIINSPDVDIGDNTIKIHGSSSIELVVGGSSIKIDAGGVSVNGAKVNISGGSINSSASGTHEIIGGIVSIN